MTQKVSYPEGAPPSLVPARTGQVLELPTFLPGIDLADGLARCNDDKRLYLRLLGKFRDNQAQVLVRIRDHLARGEAEDAVRQAHTLKGVAGNVGAKPLFLATKELESAIHAQDGEATLLRLDAVAAQLEPVIAGIEEMFRSVGEHGESTPQAVDWRRVTQLFAQLRTLLEEDDSEAEELVVELMEVLADSRYYGLLKALAGQVAGYNFEEALGVLAELEGLVGPSVEG